LFTAADGRTRPGQFRSRASLTFHIASGNGKRGVRRQFALHGMALRIAPSTLRMVTQAGHRTSYAIMKFTSLVALAVLSASVLAAPAFAGDVGELDTPIPVPAGDYAYLVPPVAKDGKAVAVSAPQSEWIVRGGPYLSEHECGESRLGAISSALGMRIQMMNAMGPFITDKAVRFMKAGMTTQDAVARATDEVLLKERLAEIQANNAKCVLSDGTLQVSQHIQPSRDTALER
jgi:hypothetical protein